MLAQANKDQSSPAASGTEAAAAGAASASGSGQQQGSQAPPAEAAWGSAAALQQDPDIARKRAESAAMAWGRQDSPAISPATPTGNGAKPDTPASSQQGEGRTKEMSGMSIAELEAELARRRSTAEATSKLN